MFCSSSSSCSLCSLLFKGEIVLIGRIEEGRRPARVVYRIADLREDHRPNRVYVGVALTAITLGAAVFLAVLSYDCLHEEKWFHYSCTHTALGDEIAAKKSGGNYAASSAIFAVASVIFAVLTKGSSNRMN